MRIIAGKHRGRVLCEFKNINVRPTSDRAKESLFQILSDRLIGARIVDLFCGSGALGLESLSRGASEAVFCDNAKESVALVKKNLAALKERGTVMQTDFRSCLSSLSGKFDLIFADPPYSEDYLTEILTITAARSLLAEGGLVVYESERDEAGADGWELADLRKYGRAKIGFWRRI